MAKCECKCGCENETTTRSGMCHDRCFTEWLAGNTIHEYPPRPIAEGESTQASQEANNPNGE